MFLFKKKRVKSLCCAAIALVVMSNHLSGAEHNKNTQSSLEYHLNKSESYFILDGKLTLGLRYGRAKQSVLNLNKYNSFDMSPGIMHMRIAKLNSVIVEVSSFDDDSDSNIVEDGKKFKFSLR